MSKPSRGELLELKRAIKTACEGTEALSILAYTHIIDSLKNNPRLCPRAEKTLRKLCAGKKHRTAIQAMRLLDIIMLNVNFFAAYLSTKVFLDSLMLQLPAKVNFPPGFEWDVLKSNITEAQFLERERIKWTLLLIQSWSMRFHAQYPAFQGVFMGLVAEGMMFPKLRPEDQDGDEFFVEDQKSSTTSTTTRNGELDGNLLSNNDSLSSLYDSFDGFDDHNNAFNNSSSNNNINSGGGGVLLTSAPTVTATTGGIDRSAPAVTPTKNPLTLIKRRFSSNNNQVTSSSSSSSKKNKKKTEAEEGILEYDPVSTQPQDDDEYQPPQYLQQQQQQQQQQQATTTDSKLVFLSEDSDLEADEEGDDGYTAEEEALFERVSGTTDMLVLIIRRAKKQAAASAIGELPGKILLKREKPSRVYNKCVQYKTMLIQEGLQLHSSTDKLTTVMKTYKMLLRQAQEADKKTLRQQQQQQQRTSGQTNHTSSSKMSGRVAPPSYEDAL